MVLKLLELSRIMLRLYWDCSTEIIKIVWDYAEAMLGLWYYIVGCAGLRLY